MRRIDPPKGLIPLISRFECILHESENANVAIPGIAAPLPSREKQLADGVEKSGG